jgi:hypothetical protein
MRLRLRRRFSEMRGVTKRFFCSWLASLFVFGGEGADVPALDNIPSISCGRPTFKMTLAQLLW